MRRAIWAGNLAALCFGLALSVGGAELLLRVMAALAPGGKEQMERLDYTEHDPLLGWRKKAGSRATYVRREFRSEFAINSRGLRGPERPYARPATTARVLVLGDSFVEAYTVADGATLTDLLETALRRTRPCPVEVLNGGTSGYSTDQEYLFYREEGLRYGASLVLVLTFANDIPFLVSERYYGFSKPLLDFESVPPRVVNAPVPISNVQRPPPAPVEAPTSYLFEAVRDRVQRLSPRFHDRLAGFGLWPPMRRLPANEEINLYRVPAYRHLDRHWSAYTWTLQSIERAAQPEGARLAVVHVPNRMEVVDADHEATLARYGLEREHFDRSAVRDRIEAIAGRVGLPFLDLAPALRGANRLLRPVYLPTDPHWNERGYAVAAEAIADFVNAGNLLGCPVAEA